MGKSIIHSILLFVAQLLLNSIQSFGQETIIPQLIDLKRFVIKSGASKKECAVNVMLSEGYSASARCWQPYAQSIIFSIVNK